MIPQTNNSGVLSTILVVLLCNIFPLDAENGQTLLAEMSANYRSLTPCVLSFQIVQYYDANSEDFQSSEGVFYLGAENSFRVDFVDQEIIYDGEWLWSFDKTNQQVIIEPIDPQSSLKFVFDMLFGNWQNFKILSMESTAHSNRVDLQLDTVDENAYFNAIRLQVNQKSKQLHSATYLDFNQAKTIIHFTAPRRLNPKVAKLLFDTKRMETKELIDLRP
jgi:outer membrane lipoprotein-sorting protein